MKPVQIYLTAKEHQDLKVLAAQEGTTLSALIRAALGLGEIKQTPTPAKPATKESLNVKPPIVKEVKESPFIIRNMAEVLKEELDAVEESLEKRYDPKRPYWSPFGPLPVEVDGWNKDRACDPNVDPDSWIPFDVVKRNAML